MCSVCSSDHKDTPGPRGPRWRSKRGSARLIPPARSPIFPFPSLAPAKDRSLRIAFDYADPGSYLTHALLERWLDPEERRAVEWLPLELRPPGRPLLDPDEPGWREMTRHLSEEARALGIPFDPPPFVPHTRKAMELALHARDRDIFEEVHTALFRARFVEQRDLGRIDELVSIAEAEGLDPAESRTVLGVDRFKPAIEEYRESLFGEGVRGTPTLMGRESRLEGFHGAEKVKIFLSEVRRS
ncbi:MAG: hypothetical protein EA351_09120 [Gemmatimonadales bacterium]|nr:MAG: hypothetical protein EA351_09120 [Gemmatimonadales bacterium]